MVARLLVATALLVEVAAARPATLERVELDPSEPPVVRLLVDGAVAARTRELPPADGQPARIVVDLPGTRLGRGARGVAGTGVVQRVRIGQFDADTARVVLDLFRPTAFSLERDDRQIAVRLAGAATAPAPPGPGDGPGSATAPRRSGTPAPYLDYDADEIQPLPTLPDPGPR